LRITDNRTKPDLQKLLFGLFCQVLSTSFLDERLPGARVPCGRNGGGP
jgi:hypothetical protein